MKHFSRYVFTIALLVLVGNANAIEPIPQEAGWSGFVNLGVSAFDVKSNLIAGVDAASIDIGDPVINSIFDEPDSESFAMPQVSLNLKYTFASQTQLFMGSSIEDILLYRSGQILMLLVWDVKKLTVPAVVHDLSMPIS